MVNLGKIGKLIKQAEQISKKVKIVYDDVKLFINIIEQWRTGRFKVQFSQILIMVAALTYVVNPFDLIPDFTPVVGYTDDVTALSLAVKQLASVIKNFKSYRKSRKDSKELLEKQAAKLEENEEEEMNSLLQKSRKQIDLKSKQKQEQQQRLIKKLLQEYQKQNRKLMQQRQIEHQIKLQQLKKTYQTNHKRTIFSVFITIIIISGIVACFYFIK